MKRLLSVLTTLCIVGGSLPAVYSGAPECAVKAFTDADFTNIDDEGNEYLEVFDGIFTYRVYSDHAVITGCKAGSKEELIIPDHFDVIPVTSIGYAAILGCSSRTITIPDSVTSIGDQAFQGCPNLESIVIPDSVTSIGNGAFQFCKSLTSITIPDSVISIDRSAFYECENLTSITIPDSVTSIGGSAFGRCYSLTSVMIPDSVTSIGAYAFTWCSSITSITIPDSVKSIGEDAFSYSSNLTSITIMNPDCDIYYAESTISNGISMETRNYCYFGTIYGYEGSTAQSYAEGWGYKFESLSEAPTDESTTGTELKKGNANGDEIVDMADVVIVMQASLNPKKYGVNGTSPDRITAEGEKAGDVDGKEGLSANDALIIQRYSLKLIDTL